MSSVIVFADSDSTSLKMQLLKLQASLEKRVSRSDSDSIQFVQSRIKLLASIRGNQFLEMRFACLELAVPYFYATSQLHLARDAASEMLRIARLSARDEWIRKAHNFLGVIQGEMGDVCSALSDYQHALRLAYQLRDARSIASVLLNLANVFIYGGLLAEAKHCLHKTIEHTANCAYAPDLATSVNSSLAQAHLLSGEYPQAYEAIWRSLNSEFHPKTLKQLHSRTIHELNFVRIAVRLGRIYEAQEHVERCRQYSEQVRGDQSVCNYKLAKGLVDCYVGNASAGLAALDKCLALSKYYGSVSRVSALQILSEACQVCGRPDLALPYLQEALLSIRAHRAKELESLLSVSPEYFAPMLEDERDLQALTTTEASLRAQVAELQLRDAQRDMLERVAVSATLRDDTSGAHGYRVGHLASLIARELGWPRSACSDLQLAGRLHDIGKAAIPDHIVLNDGALEAAQRSIMQSHTTIGAALLINHSGSIVRLAGEVALAHHEHWDGSGYPKGIAGARIPISARIVALADVFDALTHGRPYAKAWSIDRALDHIATQSGRKFDPHITGIFLELVIGLQAKHPDLDAFLSRGSEASPFMTARRHIEQMLRRNTH